MNYFIGCLLKGDAAQWSIELMKDISAKFNTWKLHEAMPPHITIFRPFATNDLSPVNTLLRNWSREKSIHGALTLSGFGRFEDRAIYAKTEADTQTPKTVTNLRNSLKKVPGMPEEEFSLWRPHVTLAKQLSKDELDRIWEYVQTLETPRFVIPLDNVAIFHQENERGWNVEQSFSNEESEKYRLHLK